MQQSQLIRGSRLLLTHLDLPGLHRCAARRRTQRYSNFRPFATSNGHSSGGAESTSGKHTPRPRQLDRAAAALVRGEDASDDLIQTALVGLGIVAVAAAAGLELLSSRARQRHDTYITRAAYACQNQMVERQAEMEVAQGLGKKGRKSVEQIQRQQTEILVDASTYAAQQPSYGTAHSWSIWAVCLALLCQLILTVFTNKRRSRTIAEASGPTGVARMAALETLHARQSEALQAVRHQLDKIQVRVRILSRDLQSGVRQVQQESHSHAAALVDLARGADAAVEQMQDTQRLMDAMQIISSKQFAVLLQALPHLKASSANRAAIVSGQRSKDTTSSGTTVSAVRPQQ